MNSGMQVMEKPEWVSWDEIHEVLWKAHEQNRKKGVIMSYPSLSGEEIKNKIGDKGKLFVAIEDNKVIGTLALIKRVLIFIVLIICIYRKLLMDVSFMMVQDNVEDLKQKMEIGI